MEWVRFPSTDWIITTEVVSQREHKFSTMFQWTLGRYPSITAYTGDYPQEEEPFSEFRYKGKNFTSWRINLVLR